MIYKTTIKNVDFMDATIDDIEDILFLIHKIAEYEKMSDDVFATYESLKESLFVEKRAHVILAKTLGKTIGYMLYFYNYSTFTGSSNLYLEDLFILKEYRHIGIGKAFFKILITKAFQEKCKRIDWVCLSWNEPALTFYSSIHAKRLDEWVLHRLEEKDIINLVNSDFKTL